MPTSTRASVPLRQATRTSRWSRLRPRLPRLRMPTPVEVAVVCELVALAYSVAANIIGVWADGPIAVGAGAMLPLFLIGGVYLLLSDRIPKVWQLPYPTVVGGPLTGWRITWRAGQPGALAWWANLTAAALLLGPPALASYHHQRELLLSVATPWWLAAILPLPVDGLAIRAALTLFRLAHQPASAAASPTTDDASDVKAPLTPDAPVTEPATEAPEAGSDEQTSDAEPDPLVAELLAIEGIDAELVERARVVVNTKVPNRHGRPALPGRPAVAQLLEIKPHIARHLMRLRVETPALEAVDEPDQEVSA